MSEVKEQSKAIAKSIMQKIQTYGFWCMIVFGLGVWGGIVYVNSSQAATVTTCIKLGGFVFGGKVYDIAERPGQTPTPQAIAPVK
jgi:hypothetical protein